MKENTFVIIMAGGRGERFWPLSAPSLPKPFIKLIDGKSLVELTYARAKKIVPEDRIFFVIGEEHIKPLFKAIPEIKEDSIISEPEGRDTAACIGYSALLLAEKSEDSLMIVLPADHYIEREDLFGKAVLRALEVAKEGHYLVTFGIEPERPETGYGYIKVKEIFKSDDVLVFRVEKFVEKPSIERAKEYVRSGDYYWNSGIFVWKTDVILNEMEKHLPELLRGLRECIACQKAGDKKRLRELYRNLQRISIDYGVMEKSENVLMVKGEFLWDDLGTWSSLFRVMKGGQSSSVIIGDSYVIDVEDSFILSEGINLGVAGVHGIIVVATEEGVLVCSKEYAQNVRDIARYFSSR